jgi:hypothetical protein
LKKKSDRPIAVENATAGSATAAPVTPKPVQRPVVPSIKEALGAKPVVRQEQAIPLAPQEEKPEEPIANEPVTQEVLAAAWSAFAEKYKGHPRLYSLLTVHPPQLEENANISFAVNNSLQTEEFQKIHPELKKYLHEALKNKQLSIQTVMIEQPEADKPRTDEERFAQMSEKNPVLLRLKQQFMLDFD